MHPNEPALRALGYQLVRARARITDEELSRQVDAIQAFCRRRGWDFLALLRDVEASPGPRQPALTNAIERLQSGDASCLVVARLTQLCPSVAELGGILDAVARSDGRLVSLEPPFDTGTPIGGRVGRLLVSISSWECERRAEMTTAARSKVEADLAIPPELRRRIVRMRGVGMTLQAIADQLNEEGVATLRGGATWRPSSVQATLGYKRPRPWSVGS